MNNEHSLKQSENLPRVVLIVDIENWALHNYAKQICEELGGSYNFKILAVSAYENLGCLMKEVCDFDLIHFLWRENLFSLLTESTRSQFVQKGWNYEDFITDVVAKANITFSIWDHLFLNEEELQQRDVLFNALATGYTVVSEKLNRIYSSIPAYRQPDASVKIGINSDLFTPHNLGRLAASEADREIVVGWAGNSKWGADGIDHKGFETIVKPAVEALRAEGHNIRGFYADRNERWIPHHQMNEYYNSIDVFICASQSEGVPFPILEAMACGVPIISTDVGVVPEVFGALQQKYILVSRTVEDLKSKLKDLIKSPEKRLALSTENLQEIKNWSWKSSAAKWDVFFKSMLKNSENGNVKELRDFFRKRILNMYLKLNPELELINNVENRFENLRAALQNSQNRVFELERWTVELQAVWGDSQKRVTELESWAVELQNELKKFENLVSGVSNSNEELHSHLLQATRQTELDGAEINRLRAEVERRQLELENSRNMIKSMETRTSRKLRDYWIKIKNRFPANK